SIFLHRRWGNHTKCLPEGSSSVGARVPTIPSARYSGKGETMKKTKMQQWEAARQKVVSSTSFVKLFERARARMANPKRKTCKHGHKISAANAHVGALKRLGGFAAEPP